MGIVSKLYPKSQLVDSQLRSTATIVQMTNRKILDKQEPLNGELKTNLAAGTVQ